MFLNPDQIRILLSHETVLSDGSRGGHQVMHGERGYDQCPLCAEVNRRRLCKEPRATFRAFAHDDRVAISVETESEPGVVHYWAFVPVHCAAEVPLPKQGMDGRDGSRQGQSRRGLTEALALAVVLDTSAEIIKHKDRLEHKASVENVRAMRLLLDVAYGVTCDCGLPFSHKGVCAWGGR